VTTELASVRATFETAPPELWAPKCDSSRPLHGKYSILVFAALVSSMCGQLPAQVISGMNLRSIAIADGTPVELRFAQAVVGRGSNARRDAQGPLS